MADRWQDAGNCAGDLTWTEQHWRRQVEGCDGCPVAFQCLEQALAQEQDLAELMAAESGKEPVAHLSHLRVSALPVYGGKTIHERAAILTGRMGQAPAPCKTYVDPVERPECGSLAGYQLHGRNGERKCEPCRLAQNVYQGRRREAARSA